MSTAPINSATGSTPAGSGAGSIMQSLTANDFLTLMTAQLKNQDPLNPTDSNQFLSQLAQLSTVTGISSMNSTMSALSTSLRSSQALTSTSLVGHSILTAGSAANYSARHPIGGAVQVPANAASVTVTISDPSGVVVRHINVATGTGLQGFSWDGTSDSGAASPTGVYNVSANVNVGGTNQGASMLLDGTVTSVSLGSGGSGVTLNTPELGPVALSSVLEIS